MVWQSKLTERECTEVGGSSAENSGKTAVHIPEGRPFKKGKSGNPGGRPKIPKEVLDLARAHTVDALKTLVSLMEPNNSAQIRLDAAEALLNRAWGKPTETQHITELSPQRPTEIHVHGVEAMKS